ncbi:uncharacterized protein K452DRAFT_55981 [Aplosporella prunicola CBS 121167]|uniref:Uncharacterized protein n=1 Tax=Aplosporella prunicola CBS 121167 TaxID=1176127 RepID=A0A6A6ATY9_9PEZI|nr:uncharacterized protein K452DRAFT_55981 [Aplosporella prunicola CBS 121167]KAF2135160.1 hypothetical protein K452DRAFT_55981 [Aplosporella prunicola CBS 121167]
MEFNAIERSLVRFWERRHSFCSLSLWLVVGSFCAGKFAGRGFSAVGNVCGAIRGMDRASGQTSVQGCGYFGEGRWHRLKQRFWVDAQFLDEMVVDTLNCWRGRCTVQVDMAFLCACWRQERSILACVRAQLGKDADSTRPPTK